MRRRWRFTGNSASRLWTGRSSITSALSRRMRTCWRRRLSKLRLPRRKRWMKNWINWRFLHEIWVNYLKKVYRLLILSGERSLGWIVFSAEMIHSWRYVIDDLESVDGIWTARTEMYVDWPGVRRENLKPGFLSVRKDVLIVGWSTWTIETLNVLMNTERISEINHIQYRITDQYILTVKKVKAGYTESVHQSEPLILCDWLISGVRARMVYRQPYNVENYRAEM